MKKNILTLLMVVIPLITFSQTKAKIINNDWSFHHGDIEGEINSTNIKWESINLPHCWGQLEAEKGNTDYYRGPCWYKKELELIAESDKRYFIKFGAASLEAKVYLDGKYLGEHRGGFSAFSFEITDLIKNGSKHLLSVRVSNKKFIDILPVAGDFNEYGGIYRDVQIIESPLVTFDKLNHASCGVQIFQTNVNQKQADIDITAWISNGSKDGRTFTQNPPAFGTKPTKGLRILEAKILDAESRELAKSTQSIFLSDDETLPYKIKIQVKNPHLWNGVNDPYLHKFIISIRDTTGRLIDSLSQKIGFRDIKIDPDKGFFLNGKKYIIHGVARHQDREHKGWAITHQDMRDDIALMRNMGVNTVRLSHYEHADYFYDLCDKYGILVYTEIPYVNTKLDIEKTAITTKNQLKDLIRQRVNHTCVFTWGLYNEIHLYGPKHPMLVWELNNLAHSEDPTRPTIGAIHHDTRPALNRVTDLLAWNKYFGWYEPISELSSSHLWDSYRSTSQHGGFAMSEYGSGANIHQHEDNPSQSAPTGQWHPEEWQCIAHEAFWKSFQGHDYIWGTFIWNMFDFSAAWRNEGSQPGINDKGLVTYDHKTPKDAYYFYKANWNTEPMIHLCSKRFITRSSRYTSVKVYGNVSSEIALYVNNRKCAAQRTDEFHTVKWENVKLKKGTNHIRVTASTPEGNILEDKAVWIVK